MIKLNNALNDSFNNELDCVKAKIYDFPVILTNKSYLKLVKKYR